MTSCFFKAPTKHARKVQDLVKRYNGYFDGNPLDCWGEMQFNIIFEGDDSYKRYSKFITRVDILRQPYF